MSTATPTFDGLSSITAFGNATRITIKDVTTRSDQHGKIIGGFDPSQVAGDQRRGQLDRRLRATSPITTDPDPGAFTTNGLKKIQIYATDDAGAVGNNVTFTFTLNATGLPAASADLAADDRHPGAQAFGSRGARGCNLYQVQHSRLRRRDRYQYRERRTAARSSAASPTRSPKVTTTTTIDAITGAFTLKLPRSADGTYTVIARATNAKGSPGQHARHVHDQDPWADPGADPIPRPDRSIRGSSATTSPTCTSHISSARSARPMPPAR